MSQVVNSVAAALVFFFSSFYFFLYNHSGSLNPYLIVYPIYTLPKYVSYCCYANASLNSHSSPQEVICSVDEFMPVPSVATAVHRSSHQKDKCHADQGDMLLRHHAYVADIPKSSTRDDECYNDEQPHMPSILISMPRKQCRCCVHSLTRCESPQPC